MGQSVADIREALANADEKGLAALEAALAGDGRAGVRSALSAARRRMDARRAEEERLRGMYRFQGDLAAEAGTSSVVGLDEVGRGPLAGPLAVGAVVLPEFPPVEGLNDSKQVAPAARERVAERIKEVAVAWAVAYVEPADIDACGMASSLRRAFGAALRDIDAKVPGIGLVLVDGNPLRLDPRERNVVKGDAKCASIAAASIVAKVERDRLMDRYAELYPAYGFESNKGYASAVHERAIREHGLCPIHRVSFCTRLTQATLF